MKHIHLITTIILTLLLTSSVQASQDKIYTAKKYPYNLLISRTDSVKIIYSDNKDQINCMVAVNWKNGMITSEQAVVSKVAFNKEPLASCLPRDKAKHILTKTFE